MTARHALQFAPAQLALRERADATIDWFRRLRPTPNFYWTVFAVSISSFILSGTLGDRLGPLEIIFALVGAATCGWAWLFTRSLFRPIEAMGRWPLVVVGVLFVVCAIRTVLPPEWAEGSALRMLGNISVMTSSTVLLLTLFEAVDGFGEHRQRKERAFRLAVMTGYGGLLAFAVLWVDSAEPGSFAHRWGETIDVACAVVALSMAWLAVRFRLANPLPRTASALKKAAPRAAATSQDKALARKVMAALEDEAVFTTPNLKVADVARLLGEADYKVTQCVTGVLGYPNFNQLINQLRVARAARMLADPVFAHRAVLWIAMDCGFGSIGPFNRAFKAQTGKTPTAYRAEKGQGRLAAE